jgi:hypothetical protein
MLSTEGVTLDIVHGNAIFVSCLTDRVLITKDLKTLKSFDDLILMLRELGKFSWFDSKMNSRIERFVIQQLNEY